MRLTAATTCYPGARTLRVRGSSVRHPFNSPTTAATNHCCSRGTDKKLGALQNFRKPHYATRAASTAEEPQGAPGLSKPVGLCALTLLFSSESL